MKKKIASIIAIIVIVALIYNICAIIIYCMKNKIEKIDYQEVSVDNVSIEDGYTSDKIIDNYMEYKNILEDLDNLKNSDNSRKRYPEEKVIISKNEIEFNNVFFEKNNLLVIEYQLYIDFGTELLYFTEEGNTAKVKFDIRRGGAACRNEKTVYFIPVSKNIKKVKITYGETKYPENNINNIRNIIITSLLVIFVLSAIKFFEGDLTIKKLIISIMVIILLLSTAALGIMVYNQNTCFVAKPIIYLYPTQETEITVKLKKEQNIICSYPNYPSDGWKVTAKPNGDLTYIPNGRKLYSLYYESTSVEDFKIQKDGFIVKGTEVAEFLEEKLKILGLTEREAEEFIVYWLPKLQENKYNYIRFATIEEINTNMPLEFSKEPDTLIRVFMTYKGLSKPIEVEEQQLETPERVGFVAVEWGGSEIN